MNVSEPALPLLEVVQIEEKDLISSIQTKDDSPICNDVIPSSNMENNCSSGIEVVAEIPEEISSNPAKNSDIERKSANVHSLACGIENILPSPTEWQCEGAGDGLATVGSDEDVEPRDAFLKVPKSLNELLNDASAIVPFQKFVQQDSTAYDMLLFWFACNGLKKIHSENLLKFNESAKVIWVNFIRNYKVKVSEEIFQYIEANIGSNSSNLLDVFTTAQQEIEGKMQNIFMKFCEDDIYLFWLFKQEENSYHSSPDEISLPIRPLETLHEDSEFIPMSDDKVLPKLSSRNLQLSMKSRDFDLNHLSKSCERFPSLKSNQRSPYFMNYAIGPTVSTIDSEVHSISSGAQTNSAHSFTDSSIDGSYKSRMNGKSRRDHHRMKQNAKMNVEPIGSQLSFAFNRRAPRPRKGENTPVKIQDFASTLIKKLESVKLKQESKEKINQSLLKMAKNTDTSDQSLRYHAETSLPPNLLATKLAERVQQVDTEYSQLILDEHVARWESVKMKQLPHMNYSYGSTLLPRAHSTQSSSQSDHRAKYSAAGAESLHSCDQRALVPYRPNRNVAGRIMGLDVNSTISLDSGNVADYHDSCERRILKSRSMPEDMENNGMNCVLSVSRSLTSGSSRVAKRAPLENDSGVSVVSDSNFSPVSPYVPTDRIRSWVNQSRHHSSCDGKTHSVYECSSPDSSMVRESRTMHTIAGSTSPGTQRRNTGRRNQCSGSLSGKTSLSLHQHKFSPGDGYPDVDFNLFGSKNANSNYGNDRRKKLGSSSSQQYIQMHSSFAEQMSKSLLAKKSSEMADITSDLMLEENHNLSNPIRQLNKTTSIVYNFHGDQWPFKTKVSTDCVTLRKFKQHLPKKGNYRYFFKKFCEDIGSVVFEEVTDDAEIVPVFEGIIVSQIRKDEK